MITISLGRDPTPLSLCCPITQRPMQRAGKGILCKHPGFFCTKNFVAWSILTTVRESKWKCPICRNKVYYSDLFLDDDMDNIVKKYSKIEEDLGHESKDLESSDEEEQ